MRRPLAILCLAAALSAAAPARADMELFAADRIIRATLEDDVEAVERALQQGLSPESVDGQGRTAVQLAALAGNEDILRALIEHRARLTHRDRVGNTALGYAAANGHEGAVQVLLDAKAPIDQENRQGMTPLMLAAAAGRHAVVRLLLERGADAARRDFTGRTALEWAERNRRQVVVRVLRAAGVTE